MFVSFIRQNYRCALRKFYSTQKRSLPKVSYVQSPNQWLICRINFDRLKEKWDPKFDEKEFGQGARQTTVMLLDIIRRRDTALLSKVTTMRGFYQIYRELMNLPKDPKLKLLHFGVEDIQHISPVAVKLLEDGENCKCDVDLFFMCMRPLDDIMKASSDSLIHRDIRKIENFLKKGNKTDAQKSLPLSEKLLFIEGHLRLNNLYVKDGTDWRIAFFRFSSFNIVSMQEKK